MLDMQNQTLITIACVCISVIAPINLIKVNRFKHCCASSCVRPDPWTNSGNWKCCNLNLCAFVVDSFQTTMRNLESMLSKIIKQFLSNNFFIAIAFKHCILCLCPCFLIQINWVFFLSLIIVHGKIQKWWFMP